MKNLKLFMVLLVPAFFLLNACNQTTTTGEPAVVLNQDSVKMQITELETAYGAASNARDAEGVAAYYADDAQSLAADEPTWVGKEAILAGIQRDMASDTTGSTISFEVTGVWACGEYATETGKSTVKDKDGKVLTTGKYMTLFEKRDGKYVAIRDIWNRDAPKAMAAQ